MENNYFRKLLFMFVFFVMGSNAFGQIQITPTASPFIYQQNFNTYTGLSADTGIAGWTVSNSKNVYKGIGDGSSNAGGAWSFGIGSDLSLGGLNSGNGGITTYTATFKNTTGTVITGLKISYDLEGWRDGGGNTAGMAVTVTGLPASVGTSLSNNFPTTGGTPKLINKVADLNNLSIANNDTFVITWKNLDAAGSDNGVAIDNFRLEATFTIADPLITPSLTALTDFGNVLLNGHSQAATFTFDATDLGSNDVSIIAPAEFEISTDNTNWYPGTDVSPTAGAINDTQVWVRMSPVTAGFKTGNIILSAAGAEDKLVAVSGTGVGGIHLSPETTALSYTVGQGPSDSFQFVNLATTGLTPVNGDLTFGPATGSASAFEVSSDNIQWGSTAVYAYTAADNEINNPDLYIRMKAGLPEGNILPEIININAGGFSASITASGLVTPSSLDAPVATAATLPTVSGFTANWIGVPGATAYLLEVSLSDTFATLLENYNGILVAATAKDVAGLLPGTIYYYRIRAKAGAVVSLYSNTIEIRTNCATVAVPVASSQQFCGAATVADLSATTIPDATAKWYASATSEMILASTEALATQSYFVSQATANGCESARIEVSVLIKQLPEALIADTQTFCAAATVADLDPAQQTAQPNQITETFEDADWANHQNNFTGNYLLSTGNWTAKNVSRISTGSSDPYKRLSMSNSTGIAKETYMISPVFQGVQTLTVQTTASINANRLEVSKIVNGTETILQTLNVSVSNNLEMQTFTVTVNDSRSLQIKISGKPASGFNYSIAVGTMVVNTFPTALPIIGWYDTASGGTALASETALHTGNYFVSQTVNGCESPRTTVEVAVMPRTIPDFPSALSICSGSEAPVLELVSPNGIAGNWSPAQISTMVSGNYTFTPDPGACAVNQVINVQVIETIVPNFDAIAAVCSGTELSALPLTSNNGITGTWSPALNNLATTEYTFTPTIGQCADIQTMTIEITPKAIPVFDAIAAVCSGTELSALPLTSNNGITGTWNPALNNLATTEYTFTPAIGQCADIQTMTIEITPKAIPVFDAIAPVCSGTELSALPLTSTNGITGIWSPQLNNLATTEYTFTPTIGQCADIQTMTIEITPKAIPVFDAIAAVCSGTELSALPLTSNNGITGAWNPALNNLATTEYTFTPTIGQCADIQTMTIEITPKAIPVFDAIAAVCSGTELSALPLTSTNGITGIWSPQLNNLATTEYTFTPTIGQCADIQTMTIEITPKAIPVFDAIAPVCSGTELSALPLTSTNGITGTWSPALNNLVTTEYTFTPTIGQCADTQTLVITVTLASSPTGVPTQDFAVGATLADLEVTGENIVWYDAPNGGNILPETTLVLSGNIYYASQTTASGCESPERLMVTVGSELGTSAFEALHLQYFPNPVSNVLTVNSTNAIDTVSIYTMTGQLVYEKQYNSREVKTDMGSLPSGTYIVKVVSKGRSENFKVIKK